MKFRLFLAASLFACFVYFQRPQNVQADVALALTGQVTSAEEGPMEGVLVTAKLSGSTMATTVVSDEKGHYRFPANRLPAGQYGLRIRAVGYDLESAGTVTTAAGKVTTADLKLHKAKDVAAQLTNAEWLASVPGTNQDKTNIGRCTHCHTLERVLRSKHNVEQFSKVIERMATYPQLAFPLMPQRLVAGRIGGGEDPIEQRMAVYRKQAEYLSSVNLSSGTTWNYHFKLHPRPKGKATHVIYTEYDLPARTRQPHDVIVDSQGFAWYASFGEMILGKMDIKTGKITEYPIPRLKAKMPTGILGVRFDHDENIWMGMQFQGGVAKFDRKTEKFQTWGLPAELDGDHVQINQVGPAYSHVDGKVWFQDAGTYTILRLDVASGKIESFAPFKIPRPNIYDVISDPENNAYFTVYGRGDIGKIDAKTGKIEIFPTPTKNSGPRRGMLHPNGQLWYGGNHGDLIGMFDTKTRQFKEWAAPTKGSWPYDVMADKNGDAWAGNEYTDTIQRLNPKTGEFIEYLLPRFTNTRRVWVQNATTPVTFWVGANHGAAIVKLEPLE